MKCKGKLSGNVTGPLWVDDTAEPNKASRTVAAAFAVSKSAALPTALTYVKSSNNSRVDAQFSIGGRRNRNHSSTEMHFPRTL